MDFDNIDLIILKILQKNSRISYSDIGRKTGLSPSGVRKRIMRLEDSGIIKGYTTIVDSKKIGKNITAFIDVDTPPESIKDIIARASNLEEVESIYRTSGDCSVTLKIKSKDISEMRKLLDDEIIPNNGVRNVNINIIMDTIKEGDNILN